jgi:MFS-type transporter involved in bile tolerance (Atg22 family)
MGVNVKKSVLALRINFIFMGVLMGGWSTRIPELKSALEMSDATLGRTLIGGSLAAFLSSRIIGKLIRELGTKKVFYLGSLIFPFGYLSMETFGSWQRQPECFVYAYFKCLLHL